MRIIATSTLLACSLLMVQTAVAGSGDAYVPGRLSVRFLEHPAIDSNNGAISLGSTLLDELNRSVAGLDQIRHTSRNPYRNVKPDISLNYLLEFDDAVDMEMLAELYEKSGLVEYAEPDYIMPVTRTPDDPGLGNQWFMNTIQARDAWDELPDNPDFPDVIIGIIDSGNDWNHPDLAPILWHNPGEDLDGDQVVPSGDTPGESSERNGIDDDSNGYVDDFYGWDWVVTSGCANGEDCSTPDNNPMDFNGHGTHCSGLSAAATDNGIGVSSVLWNGRLMCLRAGYDASDGNGYVIQSAAANGIEYAIDNGAKMVSMSFGGSNTVRTYATLAYNSGLLCFHAAGNDNVDNDDGLDRASGMISVAATNSSDCKASFSNYGDWIDISAPGTAMYSTIFDDNYTNLQGTSMACPLAASVAALIWAQNPDYSNVQVRSQLFATSDDIYSLSCNADFAADRELGAGRVNARKAILNIRETTIEIGSTEISDASGDGRFMPGEALGIGVEICNMGANPTENMSITISTDDPAVSFPNGNEINMSAIPDAFCLDNFGSPLEIMIDEGSAARYVSFSLVAQSSNVVEAAVYEFELMVGTTGILLYDDGTLDNPMYNAYYHGMKEMGLIFDWYSTAMDGFPQFPDRDLLLGDYEMVVYASGANPSTFNADEMTMFGAYDGTGDLIVTSQYADSDVGGSAFFSDVLRASGGEGSTNIRGARGIENDEAADGLVMILQGANGANNQGFPITEINPANGSIAFFQDYNSQFTTGVRYRSGTSETVYLNFAIEASHGTASTASLSESLGQIMNWMGQVDVKAPNTELPQMLELGNAWPNPFNPSTQLKFALPASASVSLKVYDLKGALVRTLVEGPMSSGSHQVVFDAGSLASGIYFAQLSADGVAARPIKLILAR